MPPWMAALPAALALARSLELPSVLAAEATDPRGPAMFDAMAFLAMEAAAPARSPRVGDGLPPPPLAPGFPDPGS